MMTASRPTTSSTTKNSPCVPSGKMSVVMPSWDETTTSVSVCDAGYAYIDYELVECWCINNVEETTEWGVLWGTREDVSSNTNECLTDAD